VSQKTSHVRSAITLTYIQGFWLFWQKCYWEIKQSRYALFSHLIQLMLLHYLVKCQNAQIAPFRSCSITVLADINYSVA